MSHRDYHQVSLRRLYERGLEDLALRSTVMTSQSTESCLKILNPRCYSGTSVAPEMAQRQFAARYLRSSTQLVYYQALIENPWKYISVEHTLLARSHRLDGSAMGESEEQLLGRRSQLAARGVTGGELYRFCAGQHRRVYHLGGCGRKTV
jgi:hypothetical protein